MLQTPGSLKNRDVSLTAFFPPRTRCVWGDNWRVPWHAVSEQAPHSAAYRHTKLGSLNACTSVSTQNNRLSEGTRLFMLDCVWMCPRASVWDVYLSQKEEGNRFIIPFLVQHDSMSVRLERAPRSNERWTWNSQTLWILFWGGPVCSPSLFIPLFLHTASVCSIYPFACGSSMME